MDEWLACGLLMIIVGGPLVALTAFLGWLSRHMPHIRHTHRGKDPEWPA